MASLGLAAFIIINAMGGHYRNALGGSVIANTGLFDMCSGYPNYNMNVYEKGTSKNHRSYYAIKKEIV